MHWRSFAAAADHRCSKSKHDTVRNSDKPTYQSGWGPQNHPWRCTRTGVCGSNRVFTETGVYGSGWPLNHYYMCNGMEANSIPYKAKGRALQQDALECV